MKIPGYSTYKASGSDWLGVVPRDWAIKRLKFLLLKNDGGVWGTEDDPGGTVVLRSTDQTLGGGWRIEDPAKRLLSAQEQAACRLERGDLVVTKSSGSELHIGKTSLVNDEVAALRACFSNFMQRLRVSKSLDSRIAFYLLNSPTGRQQSVVNSNTTTGLANLNGTVLGDIKCAVPPESEQGAIADFLDRETARLDTLVGKKRELIEKLKEKRAALISCTVTRGLKPNVKLKPSGIEWLGDIPEDWRGTRLRYLLKGTLVNGLFKTQEHFGSGSRLINVYDAYRDDFFVDEESLERVEVSPIEVKLYGVESGDVFFVRSSLKLEGVGRAVCCARLSEKTVFECHLVRARSDPKQIAPEFLIYFLNSAFGIQSLVSRANTVTMTTLGQTKILDTFVMVPPVREQHAISNYIRGETAKLDRMMGKVEAAIEKLQEYRTALITAAVTGKIDVRKKLHG